MRIFKKVLRVVLYPLYLVGVILIGIYWCITDNETHEIIFRG